MKSGHVAEEATEKLKLFFIILLYHVSMLGFLVSSKHIIQLKLMGISFGL